MSNSPHFERQKTVWPMVVLAAVLAANWIASPHRAIAEGEPAADFVKRLRAANYFDTAITYLDRIDEFPGVDPEFKSAIALERAQTFIEAAVASRSTDDRDEFFVKAESQLSEFLKKGSHPRLAEARLQLGKLQMVRGTQLIVGDPDDEKRTAARESFLAAAKTFDVIVDDLRKKLTEMQGQKIDASKEPDKAALRDQYRGEFLQAQLSGGESRKLAARTYKDPAKDGKQLLEEALTRFTDLSEKYDGYVQGAMSMLFRGQVQHDLGKTKEALDSYLRMLEQPDNDLLRDSKYQATSGMIELLMAEDPPNFQQSIERGKGMIDALRPNEKRTPSVQELRVNLAKAYLAKSKDKENQKPTDLKRAESDGRQLLIAASKVPGSHFEEAKELLAGLGVDASEEAELPTAEDPKSLEDALEKSRELLEASENLQQSLAVLEQQGGEGDEIAAQKKAIQEQLTETRQVAVQILQRGLAMVNGETDNETINQARQFLAYLLYQEQRYRDAAVVGAFLANNAPGTEMGLRGGLLALSSMQMLLTEVPEDENEGLIGHVEKLGKYLTKTWPDDPKAAAAQGVMIRLALSKDRWEEARALIQQMPAGPERASFQRLMGQLFWNRSIQARIDGDDAAVEKYLAEGEKDLREGLEGITGNLVEPEAIKAALILAKIYRKQDDDKAALATLDHPKYGPVPMVEKQGAPDAAFESDLYSTELQVVVGRMAADDGDPDKLLKRAIAVMGKLQKSVGGPDGQATLTQIYIRMARDLREQLDTAAPATKSKLIEAFNVFLNQIAETTQDAATQQWVGQTLLQMGESSMQPTDIKAVGQAADLLTSGTETLTKLIDNGGDVPLTVRFQVGRANRLLGNYKTAIDELEKVLKEKPMMLDAQIEAAQAYESWAGNIQPKFADRAYGAAISGARPGENKKNTIWGWGRISQLTSSDPKYKEMFFNARYHIALCRYRMGKVTNNKQVIEKAISDITKTEAFSKELGGPAQRAKFDGLLREIQQAAGQKPVGLPPLPGGDGGPPPVDLGN